MEDQKQAAYDRQKARLDKAMAIAESYMNMAQDIAKSFYPIKNARLLRKRPFPARNIPHRVKKRMKRQAKATIAMQTATAAIRAYSGMANMAHIQAAPLPRFPAGASGGVPFSSVGTGGEEIRTWSVPAYPETHSIPPSPPFNPADVDAALKDLQDNPYIKGEPITQKQSDDLIAFLRSGFNNKQEKP
jgi:hypothetical protein